MSLNESDVDDGMRSTAVSVASATSTAGGDGFQPIQDLGQMISPLSSPRATMIEVVECNPNDTSISRLGDTSMDESEIASLSIPQFNGAMSPMEQTEEEEEEEFAALSLHVSSPVSLQQQSTSAPTNSICIGVRADTNAQFLGFLGKQCKETGQKLLDMFHGKENPFEERTDDMEELPPEILEYA